MILYALHDALVKPMPGQPMAPSLAESWSVSGDGLTYEFVLRQGVRFHNGELLTADDVKFSFERYRGVSAKVLKERMRQVQVVDSDHVRFQLKEPWPDFLAFFATPATGAAWIVPSKYVQKVGDEGFKKAPVGAAPYRFVSFTPGVELVLEAHETLYSYGSYPDLEGLIQEQAAERDRKRREATLHRIQQLMHKQAMFVPIWDIAILNAYGPVAEPALGLIGSYLFSAPYEEVRLKGR